MGSTSGEPRPGRDLPRSDFASNRFARHGHDPGFAPTPIEVKARFVWQSDGLEEWLPAVAVKWTTDEGEDGGGLVFVRYQHERTGDGQEHYLWFNAADIRRR